MPLVTSHRYWPESSALTGLITRLPSILMDTLVSRAETSVTGAPSRNQRTVTLPGSAFASQENCTFSPSSFDWFVGGTIITAPPVNQSNARFLLRSFNYGPRGRQRGEISITVTETKRDRCILVVVAIASRICDGDWPLILVVSLSKISRKRRQHAVHLTRRQAGTRRETAL